jgi:2-polyprenyl-3-methyl-5-hydroxy-6-metoxy-1,4-benzoquinol methylase
MRSCWCDTPKYSPFGPQYRRCECCGTLVSLESLSNDELKVQDDETDFYGKQYWLDHQSQDLGFPNIRARSRADLTERNLHWLATLLKYKLPTARVMEIGCAHGSFVALMQHVGYQASGVEMSPWVVDFGSKTFSVPIAVGPVENLAIEPNSMDAIVMMDVMEHLPDPIATMKHCLGLLKADGFLLIQTPQFKEQISHEKLVETSSAFLEQLKADEHLYLFSERSIRDFFAKLHAKHLVFEPAIFSQYDMFVAVSKSPLKPNSQAEIELVLGSSLNGRIGQALLDLRQREEDLIGRLTLADTDRKSRQIQVETLTALLKESETDRSARGLQIETLTALLKESETDRSARGLQIETLTRMINSTETDRARQIETLTKSLSIATEENLANQRRNEELLLENKNTIETLSAQANAVHSLLAHPLIKLSRIFGASPAMTKIEESLGKKRD